MVERREVRDLHSLGRVFGAGVRAEGRIRRVVLGASPKPGNPDASTNDAKIRRETRAFHERVYGKNFEYQDFAPRFTAEMFDADQWADIFARSGAKYVVLVSKHHDGFALWPSREANASWGRPWNAVDVGPKTRPGRRAHGRGAAP